MEPRDSDRDPQDRPVQDESRNPLRDESEDRDASSGEPETWKGRFDDNGEVARGGVAGTALTPEEDLQNPFEDNTDGNAPASRS